MSLQNTLAYIDVNYLALRRSKTSFPLASWLSCTFSGQRSKEYIRFNTKDQKLVVELINQRPPSWTGLACQVTLRKAEEGNTISVAIYNEQLQHVFIITGVEIDPGVYEIKRLERGSPDFYRYEMEVINSLIQKYDEEKIKVQQNVSKAGKGSIAAPVVPQPNISPIGRDFL